MLKITNNTVRFNGRTATIADLGLDLSVVKAVSRLVITTATDGATLGEMIQSLDKWAGRQIGLEPIASLAWRCWILSGGSDGDSRDSKVRS